MLLVLSQIVGYAAPVPSQLVYTRGFLVTGNYVAGGVDLTETANPPVGGFSTGTIQLGNVVPANADIVAAYLFWETITFTADRSQAAGVKFRGQDLSIDSLTVRETARPLTGSVAPCWSSGTPLTMHHFVADVLGFLPLQLDKNNQPTGKRFVNDADLAANGLPAHTVTLPIAQESGNHVPESAGATLLVVYREDPDPGVAPVEPLRKIVIYSGMHIQGSIDESTTLNVQGFYKSTPGSATLTYIGASGQPNSRERILFNGQEKQVNPFAIGSASQRGWGNPTYDVSAQMSLATNTAQYGETVTTTLDHSPATGGFDCLTTGAVVFSTTVEDDDHDGLPDGIEDVSGVLTDPDGTPLPNLNAMGAGSDQPDLFVEVNAMWAPAGTEYGSGTAPYSTTQTTKTDTAGHHHRPTPEDLKRIGDAFQQRGIRPHFDVGNVATYHGLPTVNHTDWVDNYASTVADGYLVGSGIPATNIASLARGGEIIQETDCVTPGCHFPEFPGTVSWKMGFQLHRDRLVGDAGEEISLDPADPDYFDWNAGTHRRRFDPGRQSLFRYLLYAHALGNPRSLPCLKFGFPSDYDATNGTTCVTNNPDFTALFYHTPTSASGIADLPGFNIMVTVGLWDEFVGRPFTRAATAFHELGHNLELWHGGLSPIWGDKLANTATYVEPQCKPFHLSSMSYLFQVHGLYDNFDEIHLDFSGTEHAGASENGTLSDAALYPAASAPSQYQPAWFAPASSTLAGNLGVSASTRYCNGLTFGLGGTPPTSMARVHASSSSGTIDWKGDLILTNTSLTNQDVNFDATVTSSPRILNGFNDWANLRLDQLGATTGEDLSRLLINLAPSLSQIAAELVGKNLPEESEELSALAEQLASIKDDYTGVFQAQQGVFQQLQGVFQQVQGVFQQVQGVFQAQQGVFQQVQGVFQSQQGVFQSQQGVFQAQQGVFQAQQGVFQSQQGHELSFTHANEMGKSRPYGLTVCVIGTSGCSTAPPNDPNYHRVEGHFSAPPFGGFSSYQVQRKRAGAADSTFVTVGGTTAANSFIDSTELADSVFNAGLQYVYRVRGLASDGNSEWSRLSAPLTPVNNAPVATGAAPFDGPFTVDNRATLTMNVLGNDTDDDSPPAFLGRRPLITQQPASGNLAVNSNGTLTYTPPRTFGGQTLAVTFKYRADDGLSSDTPQVPLSAPSAAEITVNITVIKK